MHFRRRNPHEHMRHAVELPDGRQVQVTYLDLGASRAATVREEPSRPPLPPPATVAGAAVEAPLHVCPRCAGGLVHPVDWQDEGHAHWRISLRCPDCGLEREDVFERQVIEALDDELDRATGVLLGDYKRLVRSNMSEEAELFARALELDLIGPEDFQQ
jgi:hypothetical protein